MDESANNNQNILIKLKRFFSSIFPYIKIHRKYFILSAIVLLLAASCVTAFCIYRQRTDKNSLSQAITYGKGTPSPTPKPTPIPLFPDSGTKGTYKVSQGKHSGPTITQIIFDPLVAQKDQILEIQVKIKTDIPAEKLIGKLQTDDSQIDLSFEKITTDNQSETWRTSLKLTDTVFYKYILTLSAINGSDISKVTVAPRS